MTAKYDKFVVALRALCAEHQVQIEVYDGMWSVWDAELTGPYAGNAFSQDIGPGDRTEEKQG